MLQAIITACLTFGTIPGPLLKHVDKTHVYEVTPYDVSWMNEKQKLKARACARKHGVQYVETK